MNYSNSFSSKFFDATEANGEFLSMQDNAVIDRFSRRCLFVGFGLQRAVKRDQLVVIHSPDTALTKHDCRRHTSHVVDFVQRRIADFSIIAFRCQTSVADREQSLSCTEMEVTERTGNQQQRAMPGEARSRPRHLVKSDVSLSLDGLIRTRVHVLFSVACSPLVLF